MPVGGARRRAGLDVTRHAAVMSDVFPSADEAQLFRRARRIGFAGVELILQRDHPERIEAARSARDETGVAVPSLVLGEHSDLGGVADAEAAAAQAAVADVHRALGAAAVLGADALLIPFFGRAELRDEADVRRAAAALRPLCDVAAERGVSLLFEGTLPAEGVRDLVALVDSGVLGCYFDTANAAVRGLDPATELLALGALVRRVHVKDVRVKVNDCPPGLGLIDFRACADALDEIGYDGWVVLETPPGPPELVARDLSFIRTVLPGLSPEAEWPRLGIFSRHADDWETLIDDCRRLELRAVQLDGPLLVDCLERPERAGVLEEAGIDVAGIGGYRNLVAPDEAERRANVEFLAHCLELAPQIGTAVVATETGTRNRDREWGPSPENRSPAALAALDESLRALLDVAERNGSILALEGYVSHVVGTHAALQGVLDRFPSRNLQLVLDPYNYLSRHLLPARERVTRSLLDRFEHRFVLAHGKDVGPDGAEASTPELGAGVFDQRPYLEFLADRRPDLPLILEHLPLDHVPEAAERVRFTAGAGARRLRRQVGRSPQRRQYVSRHARDRVIAGVPVRVFAHREIQAVYLHLHGGGFVYGSASLQDDRLEQLADEYALAVVSVEYRLAPEWPYPAAPDDSEAVALWLAGAAGGEFGTDRLAIGGASAGANLAVITLLRLRDRHGFRGFRAAALSSGVYDLTLSGFAETTVSEPNREELDRAFAQYAVGASRRDAELSPLHAELHDLPDALFAVGTRDPLLTDSIRMAERWRAAGNAARVTVVPGGVHGVDTTNDVGAFVAETFTAA